MSFISVVISTRELILKYRAASRKKHLRQTPRLSTPKFLRSTRNAGQGVLRAEDVRCKLSRPARLCIAIVPLPFRDHTIGLNNA